jgi:periplasmic protein TonB
MTATDRLGLLIFFAACVHVALILGVSFSPYEQGTPDKVLPPMEIILVHHKTKEELKDYDYLANATQDGGGESEEKVRPQDKISSPVLVQETGDQKETHDAASPQDVAPVKDDVITQKNSEVEIEQIPDIKTSTVKEKLTADELIARSREMMQLSSAISLLEEKSARKPRKKSISARTQEYKYATYMESWRQKVERIGNLNYPSQAKQEKLYGDVLLAVAINANGTIYEIKVLKSSGKKVLDDAAIRIVRLAAPFAQLPKEILKDTDVLQIIRTWKFESNNQLGSK